MNWNALFSEFYELGLYHIDMKLGETSVSISVTALPLGKGNYIDMVITDNGFNIEFLKLRYYHYTTHPEIEGLVIDSNREPEQVFYENVELKDENELMLFLKKLKEEVKEILEKVERKD